MMARRATAAERARPRYSRASGSRFVSSAMSVMPMKTCMGDRISWLVFARKSDFARLALAVVSTVPAVLTGAVITETIFAWPGLGRLTVQALLNRDFPVVLAAFEALMRERAARGGGFQSTSGPSPLIVVNGPIRKELDFNTAGGAANSAE